MFKIRIALVLIFCLLPSFLKAQTENMRDQEQYLFPDFRIGVVKMKSNEKVTLSLNYNVVTEKMVFKQKNQVFDMINYELVDTVYIQERRFVPYEKVFYEVLVNAPVSLFIQHKGKLKTPPRPAAYGGTSEVSSSTYISNLPMGSDTYRMKRDAEVIIEPDPILWIRKGNKTQAIFNKDNLVRVFNDRKGEIKDFIAASHINPKNPGDVMRVVGYYNDLSGK